MSARAVRRVVLVLCGAGIAGMIARSIADNTGAALTAGIVTAVAVLCLMVATAVSSGPAGAGAGTGPQDDAEALAASVEAQVGALVAAGGDEASLRALVGDAVRLGRALRR